MHRDLKPSNILFESKDSDSIKVVDFGTSTHFDLDSKMRKIFGTLEYLAPECWRMEYDEKCDLWSIGCIVYTILTGQPAFSGETKEELYEKIQNGKILKNKAYKRLSIDAKNLIKGLLNLDPIKRLSAEEAL